MNVLVVEDDTKIASFLRKGLEAEHFTVTVTESGEQALSELQSRPFDLLLLDIMLPDLDGFAVLEGLQKLPTQPLSIVLSARSEIEERVRGLDLGADDYLVKPFSFVELLARIRALVRRQSNQEQYLELGPLKLDKVKRSVSYNKHPVDLTTREFQLLLYFMQHPGEDLTRAMILDRVWGYHFDTGTNLVDVYVNYLRKKLHPLGGPSIKTVRGVGYRLAQSKASIEHS